MIFLFDTVRFDGRLRFMERFLRFCLWAPETLTWQGSFEMNLCVFSVFTMHWEVKENFASPRAWSIKHIMCVISVQVVRWHIAVLCCEEQQNAWNMWNTVKHVWCQRHEERQMDLYECWTMDCGCDGVLHDSFWCPFGNLRALDGTRPTRQSRHESSEFAALQFVASLWYSRFGL